MEKHGGKAGVEKTQAEEKQIDGSEAGVDALGTTREVRYKIRRTKRDTKRTRGT